MVSSTIVWVKQSSPFAHKLPQKRARLPSPCCWTGSCRCLSSSTSSFINHILHSEHASPLPCHFCFQITISLINQGKCITSDCLLYQLGWDGGEMPPTKPSPCRAHPRTLRAPAPTPALHQPQRRCLCPALAPSWQLVVLIKALLIFSTANRQNADFNHSSPISTCCLRARDEILGSPVLSMEAGENRETLHEFPSSLKHQLKQDEPRCQF